MLQAFFVPITGLKRVRIFLRLVQNRGDIGGGEFVYAKEMLHIMSV